MSTLRRIRIAHLVALSASIALSFTAGAAPTTIEGQVVSVQDGDSLTILVDQREVRIQLAEIAAPDLEQAFGKQSHQALAKLCFQQPATVEGLSTDRSGRVVGRVKCNGVDANAAQVERGMAWVYRQEAKSTSPLNFLLDRAQRGKEGLWAAHSPVEPWLWRRQR